MTRRYTGVLFLPFSALLSFDVSNIHVALWNKSNLFHMDFLHGYPKPGMQWIWMESEWSQPCGTPEVAGTSRQNSAPNTKMVPSTPAPETGWNSGSARWWARCHRVQLCPSMSHVVCSRRFPAVSPPQHITTSPSGCITPRRRARPPPPLLPLSDSITIIRADTMRRQQRWSPAGALP